MDYVDLSQLTVTPEVTSSIAGDMAWRYRVIPIAHSDTGLTMAIGNPLDYETVETVGFL